MSYRFGTSLKVKSAIASLAACLLVTGAHAANCSVSATGLAFGNYNPLTAVDVSSVATLTVQCAGNGSVSYELQLSAGASGTFAARTLRGPVDSLAYNLYTDASYSAVWGDGTGGSSSVSRTMAAGASHSDTVPVYGVLRAGQDPQVGNYSDQIIVTVLF